MNNPGARSKTYVKSLFSLVYGFSFLLKNLLQQQRFLKRTLKVDLKEFQKDHDQSLTEADFNKITSYYALGVPGVLGALLGLLRGKPLLHRERLCMSYLGGISGLLDDLFDDPNKKAAPIKDWILQPEDRKPSTSHEKLLLQFYLKGLSLCPNPEKIKAQALQVYQAQENSSLQAQKDLNAAHLDEIIYTKGGTSFIYYRLCMQHPLEEAEEKLLFHLGGLMQLSNDIFDVWEDSRAGLNTAATRCRDIKDLRGHFTQQLEKTYGLAEETAYAKKQIEKFLHITTLALARVFVCLDQFELLQHTSNNIFKVEEYPRKSLICDMQKTNNQLKAFRYFYQFQGRR